MGSPNVLLLVLDSVRAKNVGLYGYHRQTTPFLSEYGDESTVYQQARAPGIHSVASHASLWTGAQVEEHQVKRHEDQLRPNTTIWEHLTGEGYETGIFTTNPVVANSSNLAEVFDEQVSDTYTDHKEKLFPDAHGPADVVKHEGVTGNLKRALADDSPGKALINSAHHFYKQKQGKTGAGVTSADLVSDFLEWRSDIDGPWAACINLMDAHFPYEPAQEYDRWGGSALQQLHAEFDKPPANEFIQGRPWWQLEAFEHLYDGTILEVDSHVRQIVEGLRRAGVHDDTLVVVTSDHGEGFGERSRITGRTRLIDHSWAIHERLTHVPLVVNYPGQSTGTTVEAPASLTQFPPTVRAALDRAVERDSFVPDGPVLTSTDRLLETDALIFEGSEEDVDDYYGPWRAVYEQIGDSAMKYAARDGKAVTIQISDAQRSHVVERAGVDSVESAFAALSPQGLKKEQAGQIDADVQDQLTELGYL